MQGAVREKCPFHSLVLSHARTQNTDTHTRAHTNTRARAPYCCCYSFVSTRGPGPQHVLLPRLPSEDAMSGLAPTAASIQLIAQIAADSSLNMEGLKHYWDL